MGTNSVITVTLDTNGIIKALKPEENDHESIKQLIDMYKSDLIQLQIVAANASENRRSLDQLSIELERLKLQDVKILIVPMMLDMTYFDYSYLVDDTTEQLLRDIWFILFPDAPFDHDDFRAHSKRNKINLDDELIDKNWRNRMCDALTLLEYIKDCKRKQTPNDINIFVTEDGDDILRKSQELAKLGAQWILTVREAAHTIEQILESREN